MAPVQLQGSNLTYFNGLVSSTFDAYTIDPTTGTSGGSNSLSLLLDSAAALILSGSNTSAWVANIQSCPLASYPPLTPQYLTAYTGYAAMTCMPCLITLPSGGGLYAPLTAYTQSACDASPSCPSTFYLNRTAWECQRCVARQVSASDSKSYTPLHAMTLLRHAGRHLRLGHLPARAGLPGQLRAVQLHRVRHRREHALGGHLPADLSRRRVHD